MNLLNIIQGFDSELYDFYEKELERQYYSVSFIPDENSISPLCSAIMGNVLVNTQHSTPYSNGNFIEKLTARRVCELFNAEHANVKSITIEVASRVVFSALAARGDTVMSLDMRKKEHCNSESLAYHFVNFGVDPKTQHLDYDALEASVKTTRPKLLVVSPINYPQPIDYERFGRIAHENGALLWCDISQIAGLVTAGVMATPLPHADVVTFTTQGALQGPHCSIIVCKKSLSSAIDRAAVSSGQGGLGSSELTALAVRMQEMQSQEYKQYCQAVLTNARSLSKGLSDSGMRLIGGDTNSHFVIVDAQSCGMSGRGAMESLADCGIFARSCHIYTADPDVKFDAVRFSSMPATTRGINTDDMYRLGVLIGKFLASPTPENEKKLHGLVRDLTLMLPLFNERWLQETVKGNLGGSYSYIVKSDSSTGSDQFRIPSLFRKVRK
ncbi:MULTISPECIES: hypothetical protein [unclassified Anaerobiospirillum]|uniref:hypothetical protein n=1 Tax=unclassified Anaerobiospirillum TaxID=2647410 RepID=UPI001FF52B9F|nr:MULTISPECIES: hypothetical protein [unclassified Anaerobiospirillum]MCK0525609.1 hypothetical protein [Anaerobiospirillum sp. NML120449]MCK0533692.1 hypothetical protein [Anaerobiospirillum sp. NML120511]MCK0539655.1 hypothetical protein [Anaerobiospirillum sp. NML02-A-032]